MKSIIRCGHSLFLAMAVLAGASRIAAQGTAFTYQGNLSANGAPANGFYDFEFSLYPNADGSGSNVGGTITQTNVGVTNGFFGVAIDFGSVFTGNETWLAVSVRSNGVGAYTGLTPLQELTPTPYAIFANTASNISGTLQAQQLPSSVVTNGEPSLTLGNLTLGGSLNLPEPVSISYASGIYSSSSLLFAGNNNLYFGQKAGNANAGPYNTGIGEFALEDNSTGAFNTAIGRSALQLNATGSNNTAAGAEALFSNGDGVNNTATGSFALQANTTGANNTADGYQALYSNTLGTNDTAIGTFSLFGNSTGNQNVAVGVSALGNGTSDNDLVAVGFQALQSDNAYNNGHTGDGNGHNTAVGYNSLQADTVGAGNTATGYQSLARNVNGLFNSAFGDNALEGGVSGSYNIAIGTSALENCTGDSNEVAIGYDALENEDAFNVITSSGYGTVSGTGENTAVGYQTLKSDTLGFANTAIGYLTLNRVTTGFFNTSAGDGALQLATGNENAALGTYALNLLDGGDNNIAIGYNAGIYLTSGSDNIYIGSPGFCGTPESGVIRIGTPEVQSQTYLTGTVNCDAIIAGPIVSGANTCCSISITGGCDLAEPFPVSTAEHQIEEGAVMVIDEKHPGQLKLASQPYDTRVAGVVSGANGINPGIQMQQLGLMEGGRNVALTGRVYVQADASNGPIEPGDLLTTSSTPGRAMKVTDHLRAQGAILGKAMSALSAGNGMVLVLVTLQ